MALDLPHGWFSSQSKDGCQGNMLLSFFSIEGRRENGREGRSETEESGDGGHISCHPLLRERKNIPNSLQPMCPHLSLTKLGQVTISEPEL